MRQLNKNQSKILLLVGQLLAQLSDRMTSLGLIWMVADHFGEKWVTWYLVIGGIPHLLLAPWSGRLIQKLGALRVVVGADWLRALIYLLAAFYLSQVVNFTDLSKMLTIIFLANCLTALFNPAILTLPIELEEGEHVQKLTARLSTLTSLTSVIGPAVGILCLQFLGLQGLLALTFAAYLVSGVCAWTVRSHLKSAAQGSSDENAELKRVSLFSSVQENPLIATMLVVFLLMNLLLSPLQVQMPALAKNTFQGFNSMAMMEIALGAGILLGGLILSLKSLQKKTLLATYYFLLGLSLAYMSFQYSLTILQAVFCLFFLGTFVGLANILIVNIFQSRPEARHVPNIMSLVNLISTAAVPLSLIITGGLLLISSIDVLGKVAAGLLFLICFISFFPLRKFGHDLM